LHGGPAGTSDDVQAAHERVAPDVDDLRARRRGLLGRAHVSPAHEGEPADVDLDVVRDEDVDPAHERERVDRHRRPFQLGLAQIEVASAHDRDRSGVTLDAPASPAGAAAHDPDRPARGTPFRAHGERFARARGREVAPQRLQLRARLRVVGGLDPVGELVDGESPLHHVLP